MSRVNSFVSAFSLVLAISNPLGGQAPERPQEISATLAGRIAASIADVWQVESDVVHLEWGALQLDRPLLDDVPFRVVGRGTDGWFAVVFESNDRATVAARVHAGVEDTVVAATRPLTSGTRLQAGDYERTVKVQWGPPRSNSAVLPGVGWEVRRGIASGTELTTPAVTEPYAVTVGAPVQLVWQRGSVEVSVSGVAMNAARIGDRVKARLDGRSGRVNGIVTAPGVAKILGGNR